MKTSGSPDVEYSAFHIYLREIGQIPRLTSDEESELAERVQSGDAEAREQMIKANLRLVVKIAREYEGMGVPLLDLINEGNIGLMKAVERYDPSKGAKLSTYSALWIKQAIKRALSNQRRDIRLPIYVQERLQQIQDWIRKLTENYGRPPTPGEIGRVSGLPTRKVVQVLDAAKTPVSLDMHVQGGAGGSVELANAIMDERARTPYEELEQGDAMELLERFTQELKPREWDILKRRFGLDGGASETLEEIGGCLGLTREAVRQIQNRALDKLRRSFKRVDQVLALAVA